ncbi:hypothetical protein FRB96_003570 [Tulasnella sp. 330]|nr:hypothetical protein FRB96_003570 [Tulasnella sp. 330]KAG8886251.1 hypothetical protein FRB97_006255 [Tulasnella sp. 331]KAG8888350.1 hypothetical protein FRB98_007924 [Tulasnella sp. 332]
MSYPPAQPTFEHGVTVDAPPVAPVTDAIIDGVPTSFPSITDILADAKRELTLSTTRMEKLQSKISESESQIVEWTKQVESLRTAIQRAYVAQVGYEELLPVALNKQRIAAQRVERLEHSLKKFERQVKLEDYLKELEKEEDGQEECQRYWQEVGEALHIPRPLSADVSDEEFDDLGAVMQPSLAKLDNEPVFTGQSVLSSMMDAMKLDIHASSGMVHSPSPRHPVSMNQPPSPPHYGNVSSPRIEVTSELDDGLEFHTTSPIPIPTKLWHSRSSVLTNPSRPASICQDSASTSMNSSVSPESANHDQANHRLHPYEYQIGGDVPADASDYDSDTLLREPSPMPHSQCPVREEPVGEDFISREPTPASPIMVMDSDTVFEPKVPSKGKKGKGKGKK